MGVFDGLLEGVLEGEKLGDAVFVVGATEIVVGLDDGVSVSAVGEKEGAEEGVDVGELEGV